MERTYIPCLCKEGFDGKYCERKKNALVRQANGQMRQSACSTTLCQNCKFKITKLLVRKQ